MRILLDTHTLLWALEDDPRLSPHARTLLGAPQEAVYLSVVSAWEIAIKQSIGKLRLAIPVEKLIEDRVLPVGIALLPIGLRHIGLVESMPFHHRDPFDRMLAAQVLSDGLTLVSADLAFDAYGVTRIW